MSLPSLCFFSPCDHICICLRAETIEIYGLETDKDELLSLVLPPPHSVCLNEYQAFCHVALLLLSVCTSAKTPPVPPALGKDS